MNRRIKKKGDDLTADYITGIALGQMGLGLEDFLCLTPSEFSETWKVWLKNREHEEQQQWERMRMQVFWTICPPQKKQISIYDINRFPWETDVVIPQQPASTEDRFNKLKEKWNGK
jgi:hypothetical protein